MAYDLRRGSGLKIVAGKLVKATPVEHNMQKVVIRWAELQGRSVPALACLFAVPNAARRSKGDAGRMAAEGLKSGVPDLMLPVARGGHHALFIEMKRKPNVLSPEQKNWIEKLRAQGNRVEVCWSSDEAITVLRNYLGI